METIIQWAIGIGIAYIVFIVAVCAFFRGSSLGVPDEDEHSSNDIGIAPFKYDDD